MHTQGVWGIDVYWVLCFRLTLHCQVDGWMEIFGGRSMFFALFDPDFESPPTSDFVHLLKRP